MLKFTTNNTWYIFLFIILLTGCKKDKQDPDIYKLIDLKDKSMFNGEVQIDLTRLQDEDYNILLNDSGIFSDRLDITDAGFYDLVVTKNGSVVDNFRFVVLDSERGEAEWGLSKWTPLKFEESDISENQINCIYPSKFVPELNMPIIFFISENEKIDLKYICGSMDGQQSIFNIKRGIGSVNKYIYMLDSKLHFTIGGISSNVDFEIGGLQVFDIPQEISGIINIPEFSIIVLQDCLVIPTGTTLKINEGTIVIISEGINIENHGSLIIEGTRTNPVVFTCSNSDSYWGGFISTGTGNHINAVHTMFAQSGYHTELEYQYGHARRQALFYLNQGNFDLDSCYIIDNAGQIFFPDNTVINLNHVIVQRAKTGGQINNSQINIKNCYFSDFPNDNDEYMDEDNDCLYLNSSDAIITNSTFMYAKDDCIDSGASLGGEVQISNCHFEAAFHEGIAMSSGGNVEKRHVIKNCTFTNCGQGVELGYSSINHNVVLDSCYIYRNNIGLRYGDNYVWQLEGTMLIKNSHIVNNYDKDIWNMYRNTWSAKTPNLTFENTVVSLPNEN